MSDGFDAALTTLGEFATPADVPVIAALRERCAARRLRVLVAGEAKRGKSTLINRLLGCDVLPTGVRPVTAIPTTIHRASEGEYVQIAFRDGRCERAGLGDLATFVTEQANPGNRLGVTEVGLWLCSPLLAEFAVDLVDTPGTGSVFAHNTATAERAYDSLDAVIVVLSADPPISASERDLLVRVAGLAVTTFVVLNKIDQLGSDDACEAVGFTQAAVDAALAGSVRVHPISARRGADDPGFVAFAERFREYLAERGESDLTDALRGHLVRLVTSMLDAVSLTERGLEFSADSAADRVRQFSERVEVIARRRRDLADRAWAARRRVVRELDDAAHALVSGLAGEVRRAVEAGLDGDLAGVTPATFEQVARTRAAGLIRDGVEAWRGEMTATLERELGEMCRRGLDELDAQLADLRSSAQELLGLELTVATLDSPLRSRRGFWYCFDRGVGWEPPLRELAGRVLPGRVRRARRRVLNEIAELVDRQVGLVRSDLAQRFRDSVTELVAALDAEHDQALSRVRYALVEVERIGDAAACERDGRLAVLARRGVRLGELLGEQRGTCPP